MSVDKKKTEIRFRIETNLDTGTTCIKEPHETQLQIELLKPDTQIHTQT